MASRRNRKEHRFGGDWTSRKLDMVAKYLTSYTTALKKSPFHKLYVDAFAGTGDRASRREENEESSQNPLFPELAEPEQQSLLDGSARIALRTEPPFDGYVFIERSPNRCSQLEGLKTEFPDLAARIDIRQGDANSEIQKLCSSNWGRRRAVLFLDPYGMQVEWPTIEAIAQTQAIDLWLLFPLGIGVNRLLTRSGDIPAPWRHRLNLLLGSEDWYEEFYKVETTPTLFGDGDARLVKAKTDVIGKYFNRRLQTVFVGAAAEPGVLRNSHNNPLYLLCFAVGNANGKDIALRIANHLLKELR